VGANLADDKDNDGAQHKQGSKEEPRRLLHPITTYGNRLGRVYSAAHCNHILTYRYVFTQADSTEKAHQAMTDCGVVFRPDGAEEVDDVVVGGAGDVDVAKENHDIAFDGALVMNAAKEAHGVVRSGAGGDSDVASELNDIPVGARRCSGECEDGGKQGSCKQSLKHGSPSAQCYALEEAEVPYFQVARWRLELQPHAELDTSRRPYGGTWLNVVECGIIFICFSRL
jgi:hypothetical protein